MLPCEYTNRPRDGEIDYLFSMGLDIHDNVLLCSCGEYRDDCQTGEGWYEIDDSQVCYKQAAIDEFRKENDDLEPGTMLRAVDVRREKAPSRTQHGTNSKTRSNTAADDVLG